MTPVQALVGSSAVPVNVGNFIRLQFDYALAADADVVIRALVLAAGGTIEQYSEKQTLAAANTSAVKRIALQDGLLLTVSADVNGTTVQPGLVYTQIGIQQSSVSGDNQIQKLTSGYISDGQFLAFPYTQPAAANSQISPTQIDSPADPAPGTDISTVLGGNRQMTLTGFTISFAASAAVGDRSIQFTFSAYGLVSFSVSTRTGLTPGNTWLLTGWSGPNMPADDPANFVIYIPIPAACDRTVLTLQTRTTNLDAGDQYSLQQYSYTENISF